MVIFVIKHILIAVSVFLSIYILVNAVLAKEAETLHIAVLAMAISLLIAAW